MIPLFGYLTLALAFLLAVYGLIMAIWGLTQNSHACKESARLALFLIFPLVTVSLIALLVLLVDNRFDVAYVYSVVNQRMPTYLKLTALWGGQQGSLLFWSWLLGGFSMVFAIRKWREDYDLLPYVLLVVFIVLGFFLALNVFMENPFERFWYMPNGSTALALFQPADSLPLMPRDGQGLNPLLRHPGMIWHPPALYLGFVGFIIPFALAIATLAAGRKDRRWLEIARPWVLVAWVFLSLGLVLGMRWAYDVLGWGGYWGWDPVEIAALMPWLSATAFIHTALLQRRNDGFKRWNMVLIILTFVLVIFGTFLTRSGVLSSVHSFAGSKIGPPMFVLTAVLALGSLGLLVYRWEQLNHAHETEFAFSREVLTLFSNLVLLSILLVCFLGVIYPIFSEILTGRIVTVGPAWYESINGPLLTLLLLLTGVCPLAAWTGTNIGRLRNRLWVVLPLSLATPLLAWFLGDIRNLYALGALWLAGFSVLVILAEFVQGMKMALQKVPQKFIATMWAPLRRNFKRNGALLVHLGVILMSLGIIGIEGLQQETQATLEIGESVAVGDYEFIFEGINTTTDREGIENTTAVISVNQNGKPAGAIYPQRQIYRTMGMAITQPGLQSNLARDLYVILVDWRPLSEEVATLRFFVNPLVNWLWIGVGVLSVGTIVAVLPVRKRKRSTAAQKVMG